MGDDSGQLERSNQRSRWSFSVNAYVGPTLAPPTLNAPLPLIDVQGIDPWNATTWMVHLNAWGYQGGGIGAGAPAGGGGLPFTNDNLIDSDADVKVVLWYGVDGSIETCQVDWPPQGATFQLNAAFVRMGVRWLFDFNQTAPILAGYICPGAARFNQLQCHPRLTSVVSLANNTITDLPVPRRAVAYRVWQQAAGNAESYNIQQLRATGGGAFSVIAQDGTYSENSPLITAAARQAYIPLTHETQALRFTTSALGANTFGIEYLLDLG